MDNTTIEASATNLKFSSRSLDQAMKIVNNASVSHSETPSPLVQNKTQLSVTVDISVQGQKLSEQEEQASKKDKLGQEIASKLHENSNKDDQVENKSETHFDRVIRMIKEQIREVRQQLAKLENDESEAAEKQKEMLNAQLLELNGQLMAAFEQQRQVEQK